MLKTLTNSTRLKKKIFEAILKFFKAEEKISKLGKGSQILLEKKFYGSKKFFYMKTAFSELIEFFSSFRKIFLNLLDLFLASEFLSGP